MPANNLPRAMDAPILNPRPTGWPLMMSAAIGAFIYSANRSDSLELSVPVGPVTTVDTLYIRVKADIAVGATPPTGPVTAGIAGLLKRVYIKVNDRDTTIDASGLALVVAARDDYRKKLEGDDVLSVAAKSYDLLIPIDMRMLNSVIVGHTALDMRVARKVDLRVDFGDISDLFTVVEDASIVANSVQVEVSYGGTLNNTFSPGMYWRSLMEERVLVANNDSNFKILREENHVATDRIFRSYLRSIRIQGLAAEISTQVFDESKNLVVKIGTQTIIEDTLANIRAAQKNLTDFSPAGADYINIPFFKNGNTFECPPMDTLTGGLTITGGVTASAGSELSVLIETIRRPVLQ